MEKNNEFEKEILQRLVAIETKLDDFKDVSKLTHMHDTKISVIDQTIENINQKVAMNEQEIKEFQEKPRQKWDNLIATILSGITTIIINFIFIKINLAG